MILSKFDVAVIQFESAIIAYNSGKFIEAITLAGAAELIFGKMCELRKEETALKSFTIKAKSYDIKLVERDFSDYLNKHRNWLKHFNANDEFSIEVDINDAKAILARAVINFLRLGLKPTKLIDDFISELI